MRVVSLYMLPGFVALFWGLVHLFMARKSSTYKIMQLLIGTVAAMALGDLILGEILNSKTAAHLLVQLLAPAIIPLTCLYFSHLWRGYRHRPIQMSWIVLPVILFTAGLILTGGLGFKGTESLIARIIAEEKGGVLDLNGMERAYYIWTFLIFRIVMALEILFMAGYIIFVGIRNRYSLTHLKDFLVGKRRIRLLEIQLTLAVFILMGFGAKIFLHPLLLRVPALSYAIIVLTSAFEFLFFFLGMFGAREFVSLPDIASSFRFNYNRECAAENAAEVVMDMVPMLRGEALTQLISRLEVQAGADNPGRNIGKSTKGSSLSATIMGSASASGEESNLLARFQHLMLDEQLFLQPSITLADVAERLHTNKTYVSRMVNQNYSLGFPEVLNILRVDYAEQYIRKHPTANQEDIAKACGFLSASSFNSTFKRITGYTPKVWAAHLKTNT